MDILGLSGPEKWFSQDISRGGVEKELDNDGNQTLVHIENLNTSPEKMGIVPSDETNLNHRLNTLSQTKGCHLIHVHKQISNVLFFSAPESQNSKLIVIQDNQVLEFSATKEQVMA